MRRESDDILAVLGVPGRRCVHLIGSGGKTALMFLLAHAVAGEGRRVVTTTTTKIARPADGETEALVLAPERAALLPRLREALAPHRHVTTAAEAIEGESKLRGHAPETVDAIVDAGLAALVLVEADGSRGQALKAHQSHEPVFASRTDLVIAVVGLSVMGAPIDEAHVHRAPLLRERLHLAADAVVTPGTVAGTLFHPEGYLARVAPDVEIVVVLHQADSPERQLAGAHVAAAIRTADPFGRVGRVIVGDARERRFERRA